MSALRQGAIGILPAGALGVSLYYHLTGQLKNISEQVYFVARAGSASSQALTAEQKLRIADAQGVHELARDYLLKPDILTCTARGELPEVLIVCPNPDQLLGVITNFVEL